MLYSSVLSSLAEINFSVESRETVAEVLTGWIDVEVASEVHRVRDPKKASGASEVIDTSGATSADRPVGRRKSAGTQNR